MNEPKEFYYARNQSMMYNRCFLTERAAVAYCLPRGTMEKFVLIGDYYHFEKSTHVGATSRDDFAIRNFGAELPDKKIHKEFIKWLLGNPC